MFGRQRATTIVRIAALVIAALTNRKMRRNNDSPSGLLSYPAAIADGPA
jgi:hypothetical protein